jgi:hypothetical protein
LKTCPVHLTVIAQSVLEAGEVEESIKARIRIARRTHTVVRLQRPDFRQLQKFTTLNLPANGMPRKHAATANRTKADAEWTCISKLV